MEPWDPPPKVALEDLRVDNPNFLRVSGAIPHLNISSLRKNNDSKQVHPWFIDAL